MIPKNDSLQHATLAVMRNSLVPLPGFTEWLTGTVSRTPTLVYDINGKVLFHDYAVKRGKEVVGHVRASANKILGPAVFAVEMGARSWSFDRARTKLSRIAKKDARKGKISQPKLVCYSYPKLGIMFEVINKGGTGRLIYDVADLARIPEKPNGEPREGSYAWSFYDSLSTSQRRARLRRFQKLEDQRLSIPEATRARYLTGKNLLLAIDKLKIKLKIGGTKLLQYCDHYDYTDARSHHCFSLHGQQVNDYCAVATCQMILCYYRYYYSQDDIADDLGYTAGSGCPSDQSAGYESLSHDHLEASYDTAPTWAKARDEIDALHPLKSGIDHHARACAGYSWHIASLLTGGGVYQYSLYIYDPWPWNADYALAGTITWEDWDAITHTNYVTAKIKT